MKEEGPRTGRMLLAAALFLAFVGSAWYIAYLRAQNTQLRTQQPPTQAGAPAANAKPAAGDRALSGLQRDAMLNKLRATIGSERPVWFATYAGNTEAASFRLALQTLFEEAGWDVRGNAQVSFQLKPGLHLM